MQWLTRTHSVEITPISGVLRITVSSGPDLWGAAIKATASGIFVWLFLPHFWALSDFNRAIVTVFAASTIGGTIQMLSHSESVFEFGRNVLQIKRPFFAGFARTSEFAVAKCTELTWREPDGEDESVLEFEYGLRTIKFGSGLTTQQAQEILAALQEHLPDVAQQMGMSFAEEKAHYTRLRLS